jgi:Spy/CpxP family protein refolding chaperone
MQIESGMKESINNFRARRADALAPALLALLLAACGVVPVRAQDAGATPPPARPPARPLAPEERGGQQEQTEARAGGLLRVLNLTPEQRAQIKAIRRETEPRVRQLGLRLRQARRALDEAIYADHTDDTLIEERMREVGAAQVAVMRLRALTELKIRRVLSPEQLDAFRQLQRRPRRRARANQTSSQGDFPDGVAPDSLRNRRQRRQQREPRQ